PLTPAQRQNFTSLNYYDPDPTYILAATLDFFPEDDPLIAMQTSTGAAVEYRRWATATFTHNNQQASLIIYTDPHGRDFFLPFRDATSGSETYGAGRYLDNHRPGLRPLNDDQIEIDFNHCYNPYCAYNDNYSCPLPPKENWLTIPIHAGEKIY
ncbi:MAG TPA: DUF1684 domain-containing protein, partial [Anaerolineae bacterium]|nr:DUF1684 domain-containing protein [Anaerolineae bacterium]